VRGRDADEDGDDEAEAAYSTGSQTEAYHAAVVREMSPAERRGDAETSNVAQHRAVIRGDRMATAAFPPELPCAD